MIKTGCEASSEFDKGFILKEENLQTILSYIKERYPNEVIKYEITKSNNYIYQTELLEDILSDENGNINYINKLCIIVESANTIKISIVFEKNQKTKLEISGNEQDKIFLLYNELKSYIEKEVTIIKTYKNIFNYLEYITSILLILLLFVCLYALNKNFDSNKYIEAVESEDVLIKLNFLLERQSIDYNLLDYMNFMDLFMGILIITLIILILKIRFKNKHFLVLSDFFLFGKQKEIYENKKQLRSKIIWGVIIAFFVGIAASLLVYFITK